MAINKDFLKYLSKTKYKYPAGALEWAEEAFNAGQQSRQDEIDRLKMLLREAKDVIEIEDHYSPNEAWLKKYKELGDGQGS